MNSTLTCRYLIVLAMVLATASISRSTLAQTSSTPTGEAAPSNSMCPVTPDEEIDPGVFTDHGGRRIYFCCQRCLRRFESDPSSYASSLAQVLSADLASNTPVAEPQTAGHAAASAAASPLMDDADHDHGDVGHEHDHATDHGVAPLKFLGRFHVIAVHFPIAFLLLAALIEAAGLVRRKWRRCEVVRLLTAFGAVTAVAAMGLGLMHGSASDYSGTLGWVFVWHRALGIAVAAAAAAAWVAVEVRARRDKKPGVASLLLFVAAGLVAAAGHFGGSLVYGWEFLLP